MEAAAHTTTPARWEPNTRVAEAQVVYPDSDGKPMSDNTLQYQWIVRLRDNLDAMLPDFVAGDLLWYPVKGDPSLRVAPDVMVVLGRPKGHRGSYKPFEEEGVAPAVVFEVLSPGNKPDEMVHKVLSFFRYGAREVVLIDPVSQTGSAWWRGEAGEIEGVDAIDGWTSPALGVRFERSGYLLEVYRPDGTRFLDFRELEARANEAEARAAEELRLRAEESRLRAEESRLRAEAEARADRLAARLAALGVSVDDV